MALPTCDISGTLVDVSGTGIENATIRAYVTTPFKVGTDWVGAGIVEATSDVNGDFTITVPQTTSIARTIILSIEYPDGKYSQKKIDYTVTVPDSATANFEDLISTP